MSGVAAGGRDVRGQRQRHGHVERHAGRGTGGSYALTFTASNGVLPTGTQAFTLIVNQAPAVTSAATATFTVGTPGSFTVTTSGFPLPTLARGGVALPAGVTFVDNGNGTGTLSGTPAAGTGGTYAITFTATQHGRRERAAGVHAHRHAGRRGTHPHQRDEESRTLRSATRSCTCRARRSPAWPPSATPTACW